MKILACHNFYKQTGGEDRSFEDEIALLRAHGHEVVTYTRHNDEIDRASIWADSIRAIWNQRTRREMKALIREHRPEIIHYTNTFPLLSPSAYHASRGSGAAVVQSLRNFRLICANGLLFRDGQICEQCLNRTVGLPGIRHRCYRGSACGSGVTVAMQMMHRAAGAWSPAVDLFVALAEDSRRKFIRAGMPADRIVVKPNFIARDPGAGSGDGNYAVFAGRLSDEKGIEIILRAWCSGRMPLPLHIAGDGPRAADVRAAVAAHPESIKWLGPVPGEQVYDLVGRATCLVVPSQCYETFGRSIIEAFATGTPVVASNLGAMAELVTSGVTGELVESGNPDDLIAKVTRLVSDPVKVARMRHQARWEYEKKYTAAANYSMLMDVYRRAIDTRRQKENSEPVRTVSLTTVGGKAEP